MHEYADLCAFFRIFAESHQGNMVRKSRQKIVGMSYAFRVQDIVRIYDEHHTERTVRRKTCAAIFGRKYRICENTFYIDYQRQCRIRARDGALLTGRAAA